jgi:hypothetical protein
LYIGVSLFYNIVLLLAFWIGFTKTNSAMIEGIQGRYFIVPEFLGFTGLILLAPLSRYLRPIRIPAFIAAITIHTIAIIHALQIYQTLWNTVVATMPIATVSAVMPNSLSTKIDQEVNTYATIINTGRRVLNNCLVTLPTSAPSTLRLRYRTTDPTTNLPIGMPDTAVTIPVNGSQSFQLSFESAEPFSMSAMPLNFACDGIAPAATVLGVNTVDLTILNTPSPIAFDGKVLPRPTAGASY